MKTGWTTHHIESTEENSGGGSFGPGPSCDDDGCIGVGGDAGGTASHASIIGPKGVPWK